MYSKKIIKIMLSRCNRRGSSFLGRLPATQTFLSKVSATNKSRWRNKKNLRIYSLEILASYQNMVISFQVILGILRGNTVFPPSG